MEITIKLDGRMVSVEVSTEVGEFWEQGKRINRKLYREQQRYWDGREFNEYIIITEGRLPYTIEYIIQYFAPHPIYDKLNHASSHTTYIHHLLTTAQPF